MRSNHSKVKPLVQGHIKVGGRAEVGLQGSFGPLRRHLKEGGQEHPGTHTTRSITEAQTRTCQDSGYFPRWQGLWLHAGTETVPCRYCLISLTPCPRGSWQVPQCWTMPRPLVNLPEPPPQASCGLQATRLAPQGPQEGPGSRCLFLQHPLNTGHYTKCQCSSEDAVEA